MNPDRTNPPIFGMSSCTYPWAIGFGEYVPTEPVTADRLLETAIELGAGRLQLADNLLVHKLPDYRLSSLVGKAQDAGIKPELGIRGLTLENLKT